MRKIVLTTLLAYIILTCGCATYFNPPNKYNDPNNEDAIEPRPSWSQGTQNPWGVPMSQ